MPDAYKSRTVNNEVVVVNSPTTNTTCDASTLYDLQGRRLVAPPAKGIYVKDGRKVVVR